MSTTIPTMQKMSAAEAIQGLMEFSEVAHELSLRILAYQSLLRGNITQYQVAGMIAAFVANTRELLKQSAQLLQRHTGEALPRELLCSLRNIWIYADQMIARKGTLMPFMRREIDPAKEHKVRPPVKSILPTKLVIPASPFTEELEQNALPKTETDDELLGLLKETRDALRTLCPQFSSQVNLMEVFLVEPDHV